jgi:hypothetical protein
MTAKLALAECIPPAARKQLKPTLDARLRKLASGLDITVKVEGVASNGFVAIQIDGSDSEAYSALIRRAFGVAPSSISEIEVGDNVKAYVAKIDRDRQTIRVDVGITSPRVDTEITADALKAQLCDGQIVAVDRVANVYCIQEGTPIRVRVISVDAGKGRVHAWISDGQVNRYEQWRRERLDRIIAVGGFQDAIRDVLRRTRADQDVVELEELSLTTHCLLCKLGTDAPGIIAMIGRRLPEFRLHAFIPRKVDALRVSVAERK